jgi:cobalt/nickel transport protein
MDRDEGYRDKKRAIVLWILLGLVVLLVVVPLYLNPGSQFAGADGAAEAAIKEIQPQATPWFRPFWAPPGKETESLLFALEAALGSGVIGYFLGLKRGERKARVRSASEQDRSRPVRTR